MKIKLKHGWKRSVAFICALTLIASVTAVYAFAEDNSGTAATVENAVLNVDDYTRFFPGVTATKLKLSDPVFTEKDWYEYIEYEFYTEVVDGDMTYRIYQPTDYSATSIMAITDYNPKEILGGASSITMNLGELQGILDIAAQGGNISKEYVGLNLATGIASQMGSINEVMDNSKYYSSSSFLGIPGDDKYTGVSNDGFFNADSLEIEIVETESVSVCKAVAVDSSYSMSDTTENGKTWNTYKEVSDGVINTHEEQTYHEDSDTSGKVTVIGENTTTDIYNLTTDLENEFKHNWIASHEIHGGVETEFCVNNSIRIGKEKEAELGTQNILRSFSDYTNIQTEQIDYVPKSEKQTGDVTSTEKLDYTEENIEKTNTDGESSTDSSTIEHALTSGEDSGATHSNAKEMAVDLGYGVDYQYGNDHSLSLGTTRIFNAREEDEVKNVGWKLCEYVVKIPYYIEAVKTDATGEENVLYGQYVNYNLLNGVSRVFANGYIEHWYTGELVTYADFFDGFITATELVEKAKEQQEAKVPKEGE